MGKRFDTIGTVVTFLAMTAIFVLGIGIFFEPYLENESITRGQLVGIFMIAGSLHGTR